MIKISKLLAPAPAALAMSLVCLCFVVGCAARSATQNTRSEYSASRQTEAQAKSFSTPRPGNSSYGDATLAALIDRQIDDSEFAKARWGISVISIRDGRVIYERNADKLFTPASNMKIYTTGVALELLGAEYQWRTSVYAAAQPDKSGTVNGDLTLYGRGAPDLVSRDKEDNNSLTKLVDDLYNRGLRRVAGNVIGDESYFRGDLLGNGWQWNDIQWYFGAEASALSINGNEIDVNVLPPSKANETPVVKSSDTGSYIFLQNNMAVAKASERATIGIHKGLSDNTVQVWGQFPPGAKGFGARLSVHNPALWAAKLFLQELNARGIAVEGQAFARDSRIPPDQRFDPAKNVELAFLTSRPLSDIARQTNKESINLNAELILRTLGRERGAMLAEPEPVGRERGDDESGLSVIRLWLTRSGIPINGVALHDGAGLSRLDLVTPQTTSQLLVALSKIGVYQIFLQSLPTAGRDGTLAGRLKTLTDRVRAKTGSLIYDNSLSGYLELSTGEVLAFSIMCNDQTGRTDSSALIDKVVTSLADHLAPPAQNSKKTE